MTLLILRPQPGAEQTRARAGAMGFAAVVAPLFVIEPVAWDAPDPATIAALAMTSANAARHAGPALAPFRHLPLYAVGGATAEAARAAGFTRIATGAADAVALTALIAGDGAGPVLHLAGEDHRPLGNGGAVRIVYRAAPITALPAAAIAAMRGGAVALLHSPRAAALFRALAVEAGLSPGALRIAAISAAATGAAGGGWAAVGVAAAPRDDALLAAAAQVCDQSAG